MPKAMAPARNQYKPRWARPARWLMSKFLLQLAVAGEGLDPTLITMRRIAQARCVPSRRGNSTAAWSTWRR